jgi:hypothetical protein
MSLLLEELLELLLLELLLELPVPLPQRVLFEERAPCELDEGVCD